MHKPERIWTRVPVCGLTEAKQAAGCHGRTVILLDHVFIGDAMRMLSSEQLCSHYLLCAVIRFLILQQIIRDFSACVFELQPLDDIFEFSLEFLSSFRTHGLHLYEAPHIFRIHGNLLFCISNSDLMIWLNGNGYRHMIHVQKKTRNPIQSWRRTPSAMHKSSLTLLFSRESNQFGSHTRARRDETCILSSSILWMTQTWPLKAPRDPDLDKSFKTPRVPGLKWSREKYGSRVTQLDVYSREINH
jgi:hypothetical protein